ncbi:hypothetical protein TrVGV298_006395 [Trichoderma virens]|nr:hypothetical protein TrVGV298_006395 [Trichoderma virens]
MADSLRLSPVFERVQSDPLRNMEGLNPERALRLLQPRSPEMPTNISVGPRMSGSNALSLGVATSQKQSGVKKELSPSQNGRGAQPLVHLPKNPTLVIAGVKRPRDHLDNSESYAQKHPCSNPPSFPPPPPTNIHTIYLESLITPRCLLLTIKSRRGDGSQAILTQYRSISNAGLLLVNAIQARLDLPVLQLPAPNEVEGSLERVIQGDLLETVWCDITPEAKYAYARQLRHILNNMRSGMNPIHADSTTSGTRSMLGSAMSGPFSLMLDQHVQNTYWASVPTQVTDALKLCILGWDSGGWYPEWWEYVKFFEARTAPENQDWYDYARDIFVETFPNELVAYQGIARCQRQ